MVPGSPPPVARRQVLASLGAVGTAALAGCIDGTALVAPTDLPWKAEEVQFDGRERHQLFGDAERSVVVTTRQQAAPTTGADPTAILPFFLLLHHGGGLRTDGLTVGLRPRHSAGQVAADAVYVRPPSDDRAPAMSVTRGPSGWTTVDCGDLGRPAGPSGVVAGRSNVRVDFGVGTVGGDPADALDVEVAVALSEPAPPGRRRFRVRHGFSVPVLRG